eukprot:scaffold2033_cov167-Alexandrium_tamarense.AAC.4
MDGWQIKSRVEETGTGGGGSLCPYREERKIIPHSVPIHVGFSLDNQPNPHREPSKPSTVDHQHQHQPHTPR